MTDKNTPGDKTLHMAQTKTLSLKRPVEQGVVRQSFSHGRTKAVVVEKVKRRIVGPGEAPTAPEPVKVATPPKAAAAAPAAAPTPARPSSPVSPSTPKPSGMVLRTLTEDERDARALALAEARKREEVERGQVLAKPGSINPHTKFECEVYVLSKEEGGRHTPFFNNYRPQFYFRTTDVTGSVELPAGTEMVMPGDNIKMVVTLIAPIAMEQGLRFAIREGGKTVGAGVVAKVIA